MPLLGLLPSDVGLLFEAGLAAPLPSEARYGAAGASFKGVMMC